jgi:hypothetical protein
MSDTCDRPPPPRNADSAVDLLGQNGLTAQLRCFEHHKPLRQDDAYPYRYPPDDNLVYYIEYRTCVGGPRLDIVALAGDVYLDMTVPDSPEFYYHDDDSWLQWVPDEQRPKKGSISLEVCNHPFLTDVSLWVTSEGLGWYPTHAINKLSPEFKTIAKWIFESTPRDRRIIRKRARLGEVEEESTAADLTIKGRMMKKRKIAKNLRAYTPGSRLFHRQKPAVSRVDRRAVLSMLDCLR